MDKIAIGKIFEEGKAALFFPLKVYFRENSLSEDRLAVSVPKKLFKRAVKRNLIRRRIKESFRLNSSLLENKIKGDCLIVFISPKVSEYETIDKSVREFFEARS